jgi:hypothetical protein
MAALAAGLVVAASGPVEARDNGSGSSDISIKDLEDKGYTCEYIATDYWECRKSGEQTYVCSNYGKTCFPKPRRTGRPWERVAPRPRARTHSGAIRPLGGPGYDRLPRGPASMSSKGVAAGAFQSASQSLTPACQLWAEVPIWDGDYLVGVGARVNCSGTRTLTVVLRQDRPWLPDRTLAEETKTGTNLYLAARHHCTGWKPMKVFTEIRTSAGGKAQSGRLLTWC